LSNLLGRVCRLVRLLCECRPKMAGCLRKQDHLIPDGSAAIERDGELVEQLAQVGEVSKLAGVVKLPLLALRPSVEFSLLPFGVRPEFAFLPLARVFDLLRQPLLVVQAATPARIPAAANVAIPVMMATPPAVARASIERRR
jgi:hypothetical protein